MPSRREQLVHEVAAAYNRDGPDGIVPYLTEDVVWEEDPGWPDSAISRGREAVRESLRERLDSTAIAIEIESVVEQGDRALVLMRWKARGSGSGAEAELRPAVIYTFSGDLTSHARFFIDRDEARAALRELLVRDATEKFDKEGADAVLPYLTEDVVWQEDPDWPGGSTYQGHDGVRTAVGRLRESMDFESEVRQLEERGDRILVEMHWTGLGTASGAEVNQHAWVVFALRDGLIARIEFYFAPERARAALEAE